MARNETCSTAAANVFRNRIGSTTTAATSRWGNRTTDITPLGLQEQGGLARYPLDADLQMVVELVPCCRGDTEPDEKWVEVSDAGEKALRKQSAGGEPSHAFFP